MPIGYITVTEVAKLTMPNVLSLWLEQGTIIDSKEYGVNDLLAQRTTYTLNHPDFTTPDGGNYELIYSQVVEGDKRICYIHHLIRRDAVVKKYTPADYFYTIDMSADSKVQLWPS